MAGEQYELNGADDSKFGISEHANSISLEDEPRKNSVASFRTRFIDSFRRDPNAYFSQPANADSHFDAEQAAAATAASPLRRALKSRHLQMIAIGGSIGEPVPWFPRFCDVVFVVV